ncbi:uncharacterized protein CBL_06788 [Carabus blaptoides fortunei]
MKSLVIIAAILGALALTSVSGKSFNDRIECLQLQRAQARIYEAKIKALIEKLLEQLKTGMPEQNIPPMDPFVMDNMNIVVDQQVAKIDATVTGEVTGITNLEITKLTLSLAGFRFTYGFKFPAISANVQYSVNGEIAEFVPIYGSGDLTATIHDLSIEGIGKIGSQGSGEEQKIFLENFEAKLAMGGLDFHATGLLGDEGISALLSKLIAESVPDFINEFEHDISALIKTQVHSLAEKALEGKTMQDILGMIMGKREIIVCGD